jgi:phenylalanyl-tRNA synthetase alpha chain
VAHRPGAGEGELAGGHIADLWRIRRGTPLGLRDLGAMIGLVARAASPGLTVSVIAADQPHLVEGRQVDVRVRGKWTAIGAAGLAPAALLAGAGLPADASGLAVALDLERLVMLAKGIDDARLLRSTDPRVAAQMLDLGPFIPAARERPVTRAAPGARANVARAGSARIA